MLGAAIVFWIASIFTRKEHVPHEDLKHLFFAALFGIVFNQGTYIFGVSQTSPIDATIVATSTPIITMIIAAFYLKEPITGTKILGIFVGAAGALTLILSGQQTAVTGNGSNNVWGDILCLIAQCSFSIYVVVYKGLIGRYSPVTLMKWMFTYSAICTIPFSYNRVASIDFATLPLDIYLNIAVVVLGGTFFAYLLVPIGQRILRPTVATMYNYVQPIIASIITVIVGLETFGQADKAKFPVINRAHTVLLFRDKHDNPCHDQHNDGTDGCSQIGINVFNADFSQNRSQAGKDGRAKRVEEPAPAFFPGILRRGFLFRDHQVGSRADQHHAQKFQWADALMQEEKSEKNGEDGT